MSLITIFASLRQLDPEIYKEAHSKIASRIVNAFKLIFADEGDARRRNAYNQGLVDLFKKYGMEIPTENYYQFVLNGVNKTRVPGDRNSKEKREVAFEILGNLMLDYRGSKELGKDGKPVDYKTLPGYRDTLIPKLEEGFYYINPLTKDPKDIKVRDGATFNLAPYLTTMGFQRGDDIFEKRYKGVDTQDPMGEKAKELSEAISPVDRDKADIIGPNVDLDNLQSDPDLMKLLEEVRREAAKRSKTDTLVRMLDLIVEGANFQDMREPPPKGLGLGLANITEAKKKLAKIIFLVAKKMNSPLYHKLKHRESEFLEDMPSKINKKEEQAALDPEISKALKDIERGLDKDSPQKPVVRRKRTTEKSLDEVNPAEYGLSQAEWEDMKANFTDPDDLLKLLHEHQSLGN